MILDPEDIASIDLSGGQDGGQSEESAPPGSRLINIPKLGPFVLHPEDVAASLPHIDTGPVHDRRYYSASAGIVTDAGWENPHNQNQGYGYWVRVRGDNGMLFTYGHTDPGSVQVRVGDKVTAGQNLGSYGDPTNGRSRGPHTHFEVRDPSQPLQPEYDADIKNSRSMDAIVDPAPYVNTVMPRSMVTSPFLFRTMNGKRELHPGVDIKRPSS